MKIKEIKLDSFRGIRKADINLEGKSAVFFGINGTGKTTILRAIDLIYANIIGGLLQTRKKLAELEIDDINNDDNSGRIWINFLIDGSEIGYHRQIDRVPRKTHDKKHLEDIINVFKGKYLDEFIDSSNGSVDFIKKSAPMPVFVNYGVNRAVMDTTVVKTGKTYGKLDAFENAIESRIDFKSFFEWFRQQEDLENELIARTKGVWGENYKLPTLNAVRQAMLSMFPDFSTVRFDRQLDTLVFEKNRKVLKINQLSDGEKCVIALFGDIARRMAIANDDILVNLLALQGVVLIDEVDLHLHPAWQRKIVKMLQDTFPNVQFIITTHSPQVLGGVDDRFNIFSIESLNENISVNKVESLYGWDTNIILEEAMGTSKTVSEIVEHTEKMYQAYEEDDLDTAIKEADLIDILTNGHNDSVSGMRVLVSRKRRKMTNAKD